MRQIKPIFNDTSHKSLPRPSEYHKKNKIQRPAKEPLVLQHHEFGEQGHSRKNSHSITKYTPKPLPSKTQNYFRQIIQKATLHSAFRQGERNLENLSEKGYMVIQQNKNKQIRKEFQENSRTLQRLTSPNQYFQHHNLPMLQDVDQVHKLLSKMKQDQVHKQNYLDDQRVNKTFCQLYQKERMMRRTAVQQQPIEKQNRDSPNNKYAQQRDKQPWLGLAAHRKEWKEKNDKKFKDGHLEREAKLLYKNDLLDHADLKKIRQLNSEWKHVWPKVQIQAGSACHLERIFSHKQASHSRPVALLLHCDDLLLDTTKDKSYNQAWKIILSFLRNQFYIVFLLKRATDSKLIVRHLLDQQYSFDLVYCASRGDMPILLDLNRLHSDLSNDSLLSILTIKCSAHDTTHLVPVSQYKVRILSVILQTTGQQLTKKQILRLPHYIHDALLGLVQVNAIDYTSIFKRLEQQLIQAHRRKHFFEALEIEKEYQKRLIRKEDHGDVTVQQRYEVRIKRFKRRIHNVLKEANTQLPSHLRINNLFAKINESFQCNEHLLLRQNQALFCSGSYIPTLTAVTQLTRTPVPMPAPCPPRGLHRYLQVLDQHTSCFLGHEPSLTVIHNI